jgi:MFS family permease
LSANNDRITQQYYAWIILAVCLIAATAAIGLGRFGYTMVVREMQQGLMINPAEAGDIATANMIGYLFLSIIGGILSSRFGPKLIIIVASVILTISIFLTGLAGNFFTTVILRALTGMGSGGVNIPVMGLVSAWFMTKRRGLATGIVVSGSSLGLVISGLLVPVILSHFGREGWRYCWFAYAVFCLLSLVLSAIFLHDKPQTREKKKAAKLHWDTLYKNFTVWHLALIYVMYGFSYIIYTIFYADYLITEGGFSTKQAGSLWFAVGIVSIISGFFWGWISDKIGRKQAIVGIFINQFLCYTIFGLCKTPFGFLLSSVFFALTSFSIPAVMAATAGDILGPRLAPAALGFITLFFGIGQVAGPFVAGRIAVASGSYSLAFVAAGMAALLGTIGSLFLGKNLPNPVKGTK